MDKIIQVPVQQLAIIPRLKVNLGDQSQIVTNISSHRVYDELIGSKIKPPAGLRHWHEEFDLSKSNIEVGFTQARICSKSSFDHSFQYKIMTQILPTNQYLARYRIKDSDTCDKCQSSVDTILHCLWQCQLVVPYVIRVLEYLKQKCNVQENIDSLEYIFGFENNLALNHILLELKKELFYNWDGDAAPNLFLERFIAKIRKVMIIEKQAINSAKTFEYYAEKWAKFTNIYDFRGPDLNILIIR